MRAVKTRPRKVDLTGREIGYLKVIKPHGSNGVYSLWLAQCVCGKIFTRTTPHLQVAVKKKVKASCGCMRRSSVAERNKTHGMTHHPLYGVWVDLRSRCTNPANKQYRNYGGRGITVCEEWVASFENFRDDMLPTYHHGFSIDRIDNNSGYTKSNCRWADLKTQARNTRRTCMATTVYGTMCLADLARLTGMSQTTIYQRWKRGLRGDDLIAKPLARFARSAYWRTKGYQNE